MTISTTFKQAAAAQTTDEIWIVLLTLNHATFTQPLRIASDNKDVLTTGERGIVSNGDEFYYTDFEITLPSEDKDLEPRMRLGVDNIDRRIVAAVRSAIGQGDITCTAQIVLASDTDYIEREWPDFILERVTYDVERVSGDLAISSLEFEPFPAGEFTPSGFPGLF